MRRRTFLAGGGLIAASAGVSYTLLRNPSIDLADLSQREQLRFPEVIDASKTGKIPLQAQAGSTEFIRGVQSKTLGFNQDYLGPVVKVKNGSYQADVTNTTSQPISVHWHGLIIPGVADGGPHQVVLPGQNWRPEFEIKQDPSTPWFHNHVHGQTASGVYAGLAGGMIITDGLDDQRGLPSNYGVDDLYLILQDKTFDASGRMVYRPGMDGMTHGFSGDSILVNGQMNSVATVPKGIVRMRLLNGANARIFSLSFSDNRPMHLIATDGGYLDTPKELTELRLAPGERAEILVDFEDGNPAMLTSLPDANSGMGGMMGRFQRFANMVGSPFEVLSFAATDDNPARITKIPKDLAGNMPSLNNSDVTLNREFSLEMGMGNGMMGGGMMGGEMAINGRSFHMSRIDIGVKSGDIEKWKISASLLAHPFHIHGAIFQVLTENGNSPRAENTGWKDTVLINQEAEILVRFNQRADVKSPYMYHCHILEHEDQGMMGQFTVS